MGWFWQSSSPDASKAAPAPGLPPTQTPAPPPTAPTRAEQADREMAKFWEMIQDEVNPKAKTSPPPAAQSPPSVPASKATTTSSWLPWSGSSTQEATPTTPQALPPRERSAASMELSEASLPTTMSCRDAFDYAWHCHTAGSQWNAVYRYGGVRSCTELWDDFWFCMRTRSFASEARAEAIKSHFRAKEAAKYDSQPSSEDVWQSRDKLVEKGSVFRDKFDMPTVNDAQFQKEEIDRRRSIRKELGYEDKQ